MCQFFVVLKAWSGPTIALAIRRFACGTLPQKLRALDGRHPQGCQRGIRLCQPHWPGVCTTCPLVRTRLGCLAISTFTFPHKLAHTFNFNFCVHAITSHVLSPHIDKPQIHDCRDAAPLGSCCRMPVEFRHTSRKKNVYMFASSRGCFAPRASRFQSSSSTGHPNKSGDVIR